MNYTLPKWLLRTVENIYCKMETHCDFSFLQRKKTNIIFFSHYTTWCERSRFQIFSQFIVAFKVNFLQLTDQHLSIFQFSFPKNLLGQSTTTRALSDSLKIICTFHFFLVLNFENTKENNLHNFVRPHDIQVYKYSCTILWC